METSTPLVRPQEGGRRVSFVGMQMTPLRADKQFKTPDVLLESNDDIERAERRKSAALRRSIVSIQNQANSSATLSDSIQMLSGDDLKGQLQIFCKLYFENKINAKNVWNIRIIDVLRQVVKKDYSDVLKLAAESLEVAGKVYGLRVDDLHAEGLKLANSLARAFASRAREDEENEEGQDGNAPNEENPRKKKQPKKKRLLITGDKKHTICADPKAFLGSLPKSESTTFLIRTDPALSATSNLFTNRIRMDQTGCKFMFPSKERGWAWTPGNDFTVKPDANKKFPIHLKPVENYKLCAPFKDFRVDVWDPDQENPNSERKSDMLADVVFDDNGVPIAELDGSVHDIFEERDNDELLNDNDPLEEEIAAPLIRQDLEYIVDFEPSEQRLTNTLEKSAAYSFSAGAGRIDQVWAGPSHWKLRCIRSSPMVYSGRDRNELQNQEKNKKGGKRKKKEYEPVDLCNLKLPWDFTKPVKKLKKHHCRMDEDKLTIPILEPSSIKLMEDIEFLMTIPTLKPVNIKPQGELDYCVPGYNYNNPNDSNYCPRQLVDDDNGADLDDDVHDNDLPGLSNSQTQVSGFTGDNLNPEMANGDQIRAADFTGDNLVQLPEMVPQTYMTYATKAKRIDMKKLKDSVWCTLTNRDEIDPSATVTAMTFCEMFKDVSEKLPEKTATNVSRPVTFVALLHLCNEHNLLLKKKDNISDFDILGPGN